MATQASAARALENPDDADSHTQNQDHGNRSPEIGQYDCNGEPDKLVAASSTNSEGVVLSPAVWALEPTSDHNVRFRARPRQWLSTVVLILPHDNPGPLHDLRYCTICTP